MPITGQFWARRELAHLFLLLSRFIYLFSPIDAHDRRYDEKVYIHMMRMIAMALDPDYQTLVNMVCDESGGNFEAATIKGYTRMLNKCLSKDDHYYEAFPRPSRNIDINRNVSVFKNPEHLLMFIRNMKDHPAFGENPVRLKNMFLFDEERAAQQFYYRTVMINWLYSAGFTYGEMAKRASELWDRYQNYAHVPGFGSKDVSESPCVWQKQITEARERLTSDAMADMPVQFIVETQLLLDPYYTGRKKMHLLYKICRARNAMALNKDFRLGDEKETRSFEEVETNATQEAQSFMQGAHRLGLDVNAQSEDEKGVTQLWSAAEDGHGKVVQEILNHPDIDPNAVRKDTQTSPLYIASYYGHEEVVQALLGHPKIKVSLPSLPSLLWHRWHPHH